MANAQEVRRSAVKRLSPLLEPLPSLLLAILLTLTVIAASLIVDIYGKTVPAVPVPLSLPHWKQMGIVLGIFLSGSVAGIASFRAAQIGWMENTSHYRDPILKASAPVFLVGAIVCSAIVWWTSAHVSSEDKGLHLVQHDPGGLFAAFMGFVTIIGFALTLRDLRELGRRITTFSDLIDRLETMFKKAGPKDVVRCLAYTPALGYIALDDLDFQKFLETIFHAEVEARGSANGDGVRTEKSPVDMICLSSNDLENWHNLFIDRKTKRKKVTDPRTRELLDVQKFERPGFVNRKLSAAATAQSEEIVDELSARFGPSEDGSPRVKRLPFEFLPGYYFFVSADRAIIVAPLQLPFKGAPKSAQVSLGTVQMLGFETNDQGIIQNLVDLYEEFKKLPSSYVAEHTACVPAANFEAWCGESNHHRIAIDDLLRQFKVACGEGESVSPEDLLLKRDYDHHLGKTKTREASLDITFRVALHADNQP